MCNIILKSNRMKGSGENRKMTSEDNKGPSDKNKKRTAKTPSQVEALEQFYDEHKYPSEFMKLELAEKIGLKEKQVDSWFCHRRLKDRRILNEEMSADGRQDRCSGVLQDSCGSTKQGENNIQDPIEVQSSRFNLQKQSAPVGLTVEHGTKHSDNRSLMHDTSSGSSSAPNNLILKVDHAHMTVSKLSSQKVGNFVDAGIPRSRPSGYLKVKPRLEHSVVTAVKMQLGSHYRHDGPPLSILFDPLPPGAFEPLTQEPENTLNSSETYSAEEDISGLSPVPRGIYQECISKPCQIEADNLLHSENGSRVHKKRIPDVGYGCTPNMSFPKTVLGGNSSKTIHNYVQSESFFFQKPKQEFSLPEHRSVHIHEDSQTDMTIYDRRDSYESRPMRGGGGSLTGAPAGHHQFQPYIGGINQKYEETWPKNSNGRKPKSEQRDSFNSSYSDIKVRKCEYDTHGDKGLSRKAAKVGSFNGVKREIDDVITGLPILPRKNKMHMDKDDYPQHARKI